MNSGDPVFENLSGTRPSPLRLFVIILSPQEKISVIGLYYTYHNRFLLEHFHPSFVSLRRSALYIKLRLS